MQYLGSPRDVVDLAVLAEEAGLDEIWVPHDPFMSNAWTIQTAIAERTKRVAVGTLGTNPYTTDPSEIATHLATLDLLSGGRAALGLGLHTTSMVEWLGLDASDVVERTRAAVAIVRALLRGETVTREGPYAWGEECALRFEPLRTDPPVLVAGFGPELLRLAGEIGDGAMPMATPPESVAPLLAEVEAGARAVGPRSRRARARRVRVALDLRRRTGHRGSAAADDRDVRAVSRGARAGVDRHGRAELAPLRALVDSGRLDEAAAAVAAPLFDLALTGTPERVAERIAALADVGVTHVSLGGPLGPDPREAIRLLGERVLPALRA